MGPSPLSAAAEVVREVAVAAAAEAAALREAVSEGAAEAAGLGDSAAAEVIPAEEFKPLAAPDHSVAPRLLVALVHSEARSLSVALVHSEARRLLAALGLSVERSLSVALGHSGGHRAALGPMVVFPGNRDLQVSIPGAAA